MKKHTLTLDIDLDDENPLLDNIAILFFQTDTPGYILADDLNHLYRLALARVDDLALSEVSWPLYTYHDNVGYLDYYLAERPLSSSKILIIKGESNADSATAILRDFNESPAKADSSNLDLQRRNDILFAYQQILTSVSLYDPMPPTPLSKKAAKERQELDTLLTSLLDYLDIHHL